MSTSHRKTDNLQKNLDTVIGWIKSADIKASIVLALNAGLTIFIIDAGKNILVHMSDFTTSSSCYLLVSALYVIFTGTFLFSSYCSFRVLLPNINSQAKYKLWFFGTISQIEKEDFETQVCNMDEEEICKNIAEQIYINSCIATKKHSYLCDSWKLLALSSLWVLLIILFLFIA